MRIDTITFPWLGCLALFCALGVNAWGEGVQPDGEIRTRQFIVMGYQGIATELTIGKGPYLRSLEELLQVDAARQTEVENRLREFLQRYPNIMDFADQALSLRGASAPLTPRPSTPLAVLPANAHLFASEKLEPALQHVGKGMKLTIYLWTGETVQGSGGEFSSDRLWIRTPATRSFHKKEIRAIESPDL